MVLFVIVPHRLRSVGNFLDITKLIIHKQAKIHININESFDSKGNILCV